MVRTVPIPHEQALSQLQNVFQYITGQIQHVKESAREGDSDSDDLTDFEHDLERKDTNQELRQKVKEEQIPLFRAQMIFTVWGESPKMVRERRRKLIQAMKEIDLRLEVPIVKAEDPILPHPSGINGDRLLLLRSSHRRIHRLLHAHRLQRGGGSLRNLHRNHRSFGQPARGARRRMFARLSG